MYLYKPSFFLTSQIKLFIKSMHLFGRTFAIITICSIGNFISILFFFVANVCDFFIRSPWLSGKCVRLIISRLEIESET